MSDERAEEGVPEWVVTFADLMTLLFSFFVLLTTLSTQPKKCNGLQRYFEENKAIFQNYELHSSKLQCIVSLPSDFLFKSGTDIIQAKGLKSMIPLFKKIQELDDHKNDLIIVEGHTDNVPIRTRKFPNNWTLSSARATNVATFLIHKMGYPSKKVSITAFADSKPKIAYKNEYGEPLQGKKLKKARRINRRVEIVLQVQPVSSKATKLLFDGQ